ncbi:hypothetical protein AOQ84DRAFT_406465 [Glonium stellatum]|uniref:Uncharacterized protein n=1 Tax=Glonium stellatum TaxID=574774 RepID=A0A8E2F1J1_9PEZI|nr:hypothetical protein AOQ84DRAFT_406465 [Glonium stellatum]
MAAWQRDRMGTMGTIMGTPRGSAADWQAGRLRLAGEHWRLGPGDGRLYCALQRSAVQCSEVLCNAPPSLCCAAPVLGGKLLLELGGCAAPKSGGRAKSAGPSPFPDAAVQQAEKASCGKLRDRNSTTNAALGAACLGSPRPTKPPTKPPTATAASFSRTASSAVEPVQAQPTGAIPPALQRPTTLLLELELLELLALLLLLGCSGGGGGGGGGDRVLLRGLAGVAAPPTRLLWAARAARAARAGGLLIVVVVVMVVLCSADQLAQQLQQLGSGKAANRTHSTIVASR